MGCTVYYSLSELPQGFGPCAVTIGNFDGVHVGHRRLIGRAVEIARAAGQQAVALTFHPHPTCVLAPHRAPPLLTAIEQRARMMCEVGLDAVVILPFTADLARLAPEEFVRAILVNAVHAGSVIVGENFRFGRGAAGHVDTLRQLGTELSFRTEVVDAVRCRGRIVSSTEIRQAVQQGNVSIAWRMLGRPHTLDGYVVPGAGVGSRQTVPTLNLSPSGEVLPARGVYVTRTRDRIGGRLWPSVTNVGVRPTFGGDHLTVETFLLTPPEGDSPRQISVEFLYRIRDERRFDTPGALKQQILRDAERARKFHLLASRAFGSR